MRLGCHRTEASAAGCGHLRGSRARHNAAVSAVVTYTAFVVHDYRAVDVCVVDNCRVHAPDGGVISEGIAGPASAVESVAVVSKAVIDSAIEADFGAPVASIPSIRSVMVPPIARGPEKARLGCGYPCSGNPVIPVVSPCPITGSPYIVGLGANGLFINGDRRRCNCN